MIDLSPDEAKTVREILRVYAPMAEALVFGSRATKASRPFSDLDVALVAPKRLIVLELERIREAFEESSLNFQGGYRRLAPREPVIQAHDREGLRSNR